MVELVTQLRFRIEFATPFRVSSGEAAPGVDATVDPTEPLPASSLKGVMKATSLDLGVAERLVTEVFGSERRASPWAWSAAVPVDAWSAPQVVSRVALDEHHAATRDMLGMAEQICAGAAEFTVTQLDRCAAPESGRAEADARLAHVAVLAVAGQATRSLGGSRRRGLGWVRIRCLDPVVTREHAERVRAVVA